MSEVLSYIFGRHEHIMEGISELFFFEDEKKLMNHLKHHLMIFGVDCESEFLFDNIVRFKVFAGFSADDECVNITMHTSECKITFPFSRTDYLRGIFEIHECKESQCRILRNPTVSKIVNEWNISHILELDYLAFYGANALDVQGKMYDNVSCKECMNSKQFENYCKLAAGYSKPVVLKFQKINKQAITPFKSRTSDTGYDVNVISAKEIGPDVWICDTGLQLECDSRFWICLAPRSSIGKSGYELANSIGVIDLNYGGRIMLQLRKVHVSALPIESLLPWRIGQVFLMPRIHAQLLEVDDFTKTERGEKGFGSSG